MKIGDEVYIHGYVDEIRKDVIIIRNEGGYFGTVPSEVNSSEKPNNCEDCIWSVCNYNKAFEDEPTDCETCLHKGDCEWELWQECPYEPKEERSE